MWNVNGEKYASITSFAQARDQQIDSKELRGLGEKSIPILNRALEQLAEKRDHQPRLIYSLPTSLGLIENKLAQKPKARVANLA